MRPALFAVINIVGKWNRNRLVIRLRRDGLTCKSGSRKELDDVGMIEKQYFIEVDLRSIKDFRAKAPEKLRAIIDKACEDLSIKASDFNVKYDHQQKPVYFIN